MPSNWQMSTAKTCCRTFFLITRADFNKNKMESIMERQNLCFSSYKTHILKVKLLRVGTQERKKRAFFVLLILSEVNFFNIVVFYVNV